MSKNKEINSRRDSAAYDTRFKLTLCHPKYWGTWCLLAVMFLFSWMPVRWRDGLAKALAPAVLKLAKKPVAIARINLQICFPQLTVSEREQLLYENIVAGLQSMLAFGEPTFRSKEYLLARYTVTGWQHVEKLHEAGQPIIFLMPHAWAVDMAGLYLSTHEYTMCTMMHSVPNKLYDWFINRQRERFGGLVYERSAGLKPIIRNLKNACNFFYLPDQDHGPEGSLFVDFFGRKKATLPALPKLCKLTGASVVPMFIAYDSATSKYILEFLPELENYPSGDIEADTLRMNQVIENMVSRYRSHYMWFLKYFRSRPDNNPERTYPRM